MKKKFFVAATAALMTLASCESDGGTSTYTYSVPTYNLVTDDVAGGEPVVSGSIYKYNFDLMSGKVTMGSEIAVSTGNTVSFMTGSIPYAAGMYKPDEQDSQYGEVIFIKALNAGAESNEEKVSNLECQLTSFAYVPPEITGLPSVSYPTGLKYTLMSYNIGQSYRVRTFWHDMTFRGNTTTHYPDKSGSSKTYSNADVLYRVVMNVKEKKATVILYNAKLAEEMPNPITNIVLKDLPLAFDGAGFSINAADVTPVIYEAGVATPNTQFAFDKFTLRSVGDLTSCTIFYKVAGKYEGEFNGSYVLKVKSSEDK